MLKKKVQFLAKKNEFRIDVLSAVLSSKASISYERFLANDFSVGINVNYSDSKKLTEDFEDGYTNNLPKYEFNPYVRYALSKSKTRLKVEKKIHESF